MLNAMLSIFKLAIFSVFVIILANWVKWDGRTLSEHVSRGIHHAETSETAATVSHSVSGAVGSVTGTVKQWTRKFTQGEVGEARKESRQHRTHARASTSPTAVKVAANSENDSNGNENTDRAPSTAAAPVRDARSDESDQIPSSERQKLRALIRELNSSHGRDDRRAD
jgi:hypothetical protein